MDKEITYDQSNYPVWADNTHNEHPKGDGQMPANTNTAQNIQDINAAYNQAVKSRQTDTFAPDKAASWDGSYRPKGT